MRGERPTNRQIMPSSGKNERKRRRGIPHPTDHPAMVSFSLHAKRAVAETLKRSKIKVPLSS